MGTKLEPNQVGKLTRRNFLKGSALSAAGFAVASLVGCDSGSSTKQGPNGNLPEQWDIETDVLVVGLGAGGLCSAISAKKAGVENVLILEVAPEELSGGTTRVSGDMLMIPNTVEDGVAYQTTLNEGYTVPEDLMQAWAEGVHGNMQWLTEELGYDLQAGTAAAPEFPGLPGSDAIKTYYVDGIVGKSSLWLPLMDTAAELGVEIQYEMRATDLIYNYETKEVYGVIAGGKNIKAHKGVVLACGGFAASPDMMQNYYVELGCEGTMFCGSPYNVGDGIKMAQQIGADIWHMNSYAGAMVCVRAESPESGAGAVPFPRSHDYIFVNNEGNRFMYEETSTDLRHGKYKDKGVWPLLQVPTPSYMILGSKAGSADFLGAIPYMGWTVIMKTGLNTNQELLDAGIMVKADTIEDIASQIGYPASALSNTLNTYNQYCANGSDPDFGRGEAVYGEYYFDATENATAYGEDTHSEEGAEVIKPFALEALEPPFYAIQISLGMLNTQGGPKRSGLSEVLDLKGNPMPRLYSAGELGSIYGYMYNGGGNISEAVATGRVAGQQCAALDAWDA